jgi:hypothetical protein
MSDGNKITRLNEGPAGGPSNGFDRGMAGDFGMRGRRGRGGAGMDMGRRKKPCFDYHSKSARPLRRSLTLISNHNLDRQGILCPRSQLPLRARTRYHVRLTRSSYGHAIRNATHAFPLHDAISPKWITKFYRSSRRRPTGQQRINASGWCQ